MNFQLFSLFAILLICSAVALPSAERREYKKKMVDSIKGIPINLGHLRNMVVGVPSNETGARVAKWKKEKGGVNPEELGDYAEGDILVPQSKTRNGVVAQTYRWRHGVVPYVIDNTFTQEALGLIKAAMADFEYYTCIKFVPAHQGHRDYLHITNQYEGCYSMVGRMGGPQDVNLQSPGCTSDKGTPIHELMHAVGFKHEQSRYERDNYVKINWENIEQNQRHNFDKAKFGETDAFGVPYDYESVMHYSGNSFSINGSPTVEAKADPNMELGQRQGFSTGDAEKINRMYNCQGKRRYK